jgi:hypothetical protein
VEYFDHGRDMFVTMSGSDCSAKNTRHEIRNFTIDLLVAGLVPYPLERRVPHPESCTWILKSIHSDDVNHPASAVFLHEDF